MSEFVAIEQNDFPETKTRTSNYKQLLKEFNASQLERAKRDVSGFSAKPKTIEATLRKYAKKLDMVVEIVVSKDKELFIKKV